MGKVSPKTAAGGELAEQRGGQLAAGPLPDFMTEHRQEGTSLLREFVRPPRIKFVQHLSKKPLSDLFSPGDAVVMPMMQQIAEYDKEERQPAFFFVPILFYPEWIAWNPIETKGSLPATRGRSLDPRSPIAAKSRDERLRQSEPCPEMPKTQDGKPLFVRYLEHLTFIVNILPPHPLADLPVTISYSSGEHRYGSSFITLIQLRKGPPFGCQFQGVIRERDNGKGRWFGLDAENPSADSGVSGFVQERERYDAYRAIWQEYDRLYKERLLEVNYDDEVGGADAEAQQPADSKQF